MSNDTSFALDPQAVAREPTQQRARDRFEAILREAENLLVQSGISGFSIPVLAERLGITRGSVYSYFPTPYALMNALAERYLTTMETMYQAQAERLASLPWHEAIKVEVDLAVEFYEGNVAARLLMLGGAVTDDSYRAQEMTINRLGNLARGMLESRGIAIPKEPDVATLTTDLGVTCFRRSFFEHGRITPQYKEAAITAMQSFLRNFIEGAKRS